MRWRLQDKIRNLRAAGNHREADNLVFEAFADKIESLGPSKGHWRQDKLSWNEITTMGIHHRSSLYELCCQRLHENSRDPRNKADSFLAMYKEMQEFG